eukprot:scaffold858_cov65-Phaeocystis_antarctica.AAC.1
MPAPVEFSSYLRLPPTMARACWAERGWAAWGDATSAAPRWAPSVRGPSCARRRSAPTRPGRRSARYCLRACVASARSCTPRRDGSYLSGDADTRPCAAGAAWAAARAPPCSLSSPHAGDRRRCPSRHHRWAGRRPNRPLPQLSPPPPRRRTGPRRRACAAAGPRPAPAAAPAAAAAAATPSAAAAARTAAAAAPPQR